MIALVNGITKWGTLDDVMREPSVGGLKQRRILWIATLAALDRLIRGWRGSMRDNVASSAGERMYSASPRGIMVSAVMGGGRRVVQFCYICMTRGSENVRTV